MTHLHITSWVLALILFAAVLVLSNQGKEKPAKILQMILRLDYLFILYSGGDLFANYLGTGGATFGEVIVKVLAGLWIIAAMEMIVMKKAKGKPVSGWWIQWGIALVIALVLGFGRLPLGFQWFS
ncbi:uncharacterized protein DUF1516 [Melghiribacillus thermohalophilus]|uniref:UPF0344 protein EDD68_1331 n=1 Tax=Melghiribacillus thermohalophilus TaxID=1324956 RepID=A0A4R3MPI3_9BACI|nr:YisL family protein [Melghiribacillus thermohalophilus]TCT16684.1 uncharacterized protein DUF1516 [Melghiribacillus thermohalophilus]